MTALLIHPVEAGNEAFSATYEVTKVTVLQVTGRAGGRLLHKEKGKRAKGKRKKQEGLPAPFCPKTW
jgi:hypothetical protein